MKWDSESLYESYQSNSHRGQLTSLCPTSQLPAVPSPHWTIWQMGTMGAKEETWPARCTPILVAVGEWSAVKRAILICPAQPVLFCWLFLHCSKLHFQASLLPKLPEVPALTCWPNCNEKLLVYNDADLCYCDQDNRNPSKRNNAKQQLKENTCAGPEVQLCAEGAPEQKLPLRMPSQVSQAICKRPQLPLTTMPPEVLTRVLLTLLNFAFLVDFGFLRPPSFWWLLTFLHQLPWRRIPEIHHACLWPGLLHQAQKPGEAGRADGRKSKDLSSNLIWPINSSMARSKATSFSVHVLSPFSDGGNDTDPASFKGRKQCFA